MPKELTLPSGKVAIIEKGKGTHPVLLFCIGGLEIQRCLFSCRLVCIFLMFRLKYGPEIRMLLVNTIQNYTGLKIQHQPLLYSDIYFCVQVRL